MNKIKRFAIFALLPVVLPMTLLTACGEPEDTRPGQPVKTRQTAFKEIIRSFEPMGIMLREDRYDPEQFLKMTEALIARRDAPWAHFAADTNYPPTKASPAVWEQPEKFEAERENFIRATDALLSAAQSQDKARVSGPYQAVYDSCKSCHATFKAR